MGNMYLFFVVVLFALAISDLIVGVSNDAVNFLNSSIGSKAAPFKVIMIIAALGILVGATFSSGMMEVARKGIFHPDQFYFGEIMILFLAVMLTDIILLDVFNTYALPTSTTVSIVFELLGAAVAISIIKISRAAGDAGSLANYINSSKALAIILGILISVIVAFSVGALIQYLTRILFSFRYAVSFKYFGAIWGGLAITAITYFILIKGLKGSSFASYELANGEILKDWVNHNTISIIGFSFLGWTIFLQVFSWIAKLNILKMIVLVGTFALAMAFAGNDLVNFIGVPLAGYESYKAFIASGQEPGQLLMESLAGPVKTPTGFLLVAGLIMVITLWLSKKARSVTATTLDLSRQDEGSERFESSTVAQVIVRQFIGLGNAIAFIVPASVRKWVNNRFERTEYDKMKQDKGVSFDLIRASVNLTVASILIAIGTSLKLPLSTTYVTFMVAMGTSLADRAWGRESAVYRITGVITVITGWFFTALIAFTVAFVIAIILFYLKIIGVILLSTLAVIFIIRTHAIHKKREEEKNRKDNLEEADGPLDIKNITNACKENIIEILSDSAKAYNKSIEAVVEENRKKIKKASSEIRKLNKKSKELKDSLHLVITRLQEDSLESGHYYVQVLDYLRETAHCLTYISEPIFLHIENNHPPIAPKQVEELLEIKEEITQLFHMSEQIILSDDYNKLDVVLDQQQVIIDNIQKYRKGLIKSLKKEALSTKSSMLFMEILNESKNLALYVINIIKAQRDFVQHEAESNDL
ncbi:MAG: inorganic phosphate transporter [Bacteroidales bacterium]|nr:inorganic phosphate transporter [Bacteroidales bacterium]